MFWDDRQRKKPGKGIKEALIALQKGKCMYCGHAPGPEYMHVDHKNPVANNGNNSLANYQLLCAPCNTLKGAKTDGEFRRLYNLGPVKGAQPPAKRIPRSYFEEISKAVKAKVAAKRKREASLGWW